MGICTSLVEVVATSRCSTDTSHFIHSLISWWAFGLPTLSLLWTVLLWIFVNWFLCVCVCMYVLVMFQGVNLCLTPWETAKLFFKVHNYISPPTMSESANLHISWATCVTVGSIVATLQSGKSHILVFAWISWWRMLWIFSHGFSSLCTFFWELLKSCAHFLIRLSFYFEFLKHCFL